MIFRHDPWLLVLNSPPIPHELTYYLYNSPFVTSFNSYHGSCADSICVHCTCCIYTYIYIAFTEMCGCSSGTAHLHTGAVDYGGCDYGECEYSGCDYGECDYGGCVRVRVWPIG